MATAVWSYSSITLPTKKLNEKWREPKHFDRLLLDSLLDFNVWLQIDFQIILIDWVPQSLVSPVGWNLIRFITMSQFSLGQLSWWSNYLQHVFGIELRHLLKRSPSLHFDGPAFRLFAKFSKFQLAKLVFQSKKIHPQEIQLSNIGFCFCYQAFFFESDSEVWLC